MGFWVYLRISFVCFEKKKRDFNVLSVDFKKCLLLSFLKKHNSLIITFLVEKNDFSFV